MRWGIGRVVLVALAVAAWGAAPRARPRALTEEEAKEAAALTGRVIRHGIDGELEQAVKLAEQIAAYRRQRQGAGHWQAINARFAVQEWRRLVAVPAKARTEFLRARTLNNEGVTLQKRGHYREAEKPLRQALVIREKALGKEHPHTAASYSNVASCLDALGKHAEALPLLRQAL